MNTEQSSFKITVGFKTKILNVFRKIFTIPVFESILLKLLKSKLSWFFYKLIPPNYLYSKNSIRNCTRRGLAYELDLANFNDHLIFYEYDDACYDFLIDYLKSAEVIFDIGANIGSTALYFAQINPNATIVAVEPHPTTFQKAVKNLSLNNFKHIKLYNIGFGSEKGTAKLFEVNDQNIGMNRILSDDKPFPFKVINIETLDNFMSENCLYPSVIKIDVEGFEHEVLKGGIEFLKARKPILFLELDDKNLKANGSSAVELLKFINSLGYIDFLNANDGKKVEIG
ncbi:MAG: FkbM family methyltransferase, partial [Cytophagales bacterium]